MSNNDDPGRWFYCKACGLPAVVFSDGSCGHTDPACRMYSDSDSRTYAVANLTAIACRVPPEFGGQKISG